MDIKKYTPEQEKSIEEVMEEFLHLPEIQAGKDIWQSNYHPKDVFGHTMDVIEISKKENPNDLDQIIASVLHDIGKPATKKLKLDKKANPKLHEISGELLHSFEGHEKKGGEIVRTLDKTLFEKYGLDQERIAKIVELHFEPLKYINKMKDIGKNITSEQIKELLDELKTNLEKTGLRDEVATIFYADKKSQGDSATDIDFLMEVRNYILGKEIDIEKMTTLFKSVYFEK